MYGSDQSASLEESDIKLIVAACKAVSKAMSDCVKKYSDEEKEIAKKLRAHTIL
jgi:sialic acid synthase SpsE